MAAATIGCVGSGWAANESDKRLPSDWQQLTQAYRGGSDSIGGGASVADPSAQQPRNEAPSTPPMEPAAKRQKTESPISTIVTIGLYYCSIAI